MIRNRFLLVACLAAVAGAASADKIPTWLVGNYKGYSDYMKASYNLEISSAGLVFGQTILSKKAPHDVNGRYHHEELIIGEKIYGVNRRSYGIQLVNEGNPKDTIDLKRS